MMDEMYVNMKNKKIEYIIRVIDKKKIYTFLLYTLIIIGFCIRLVGLGHYPLGLNQDEASAGYDAYSIFKYGVDRNGNSYPIFLLAWGSGQNALYSYLCIPFIAFLGLNEFAIRLPMAIIGCISVVVVANLAKILFKNNSYTLIVTFFFAICPWHIMKSRWALESNIFPDIILLCFYFLVIYVKKNKNIFIYIAAFLLGISVYSYGTAYLFTPIFALMLVMILLKDKKIKIKQLLITSIITMITVMPMIFFVVINTFNLKQIKLGKVTIPKLNVSRHMQLSPIFSENFLKDIWDNFVEFSNIILKQNDNLNWNGYGYFGIIYSISIPFFLIGVSYIFKIIKTKKDIIDNENNTCLKVLLSWLFVGAILAIMVIPNINRINIFIMPMVLISAIGLAYCCEKIACSRKIILFAYTLMFFSFIYSYSHEYQDNIKHSFFYSLGEAINFSNNLLVDRIYITSSVNMPYIFNLFYTKGNSFEYIDTVEYDNQGDDFEMVNSYGKFSFYLPEDTYIDDNEKYAIILNNNELCLYDLNRYKIVQYELYSVIYID